MVRRRTEEGSEGRRRHLHCSEKEEEVHSQDDTSDDGDHTKSNKKLERESIVVTLLSLNLTPSWPKNVIARAPAVIMRRAPTRVVMISRRVGGKWPSR